MMKTVGFIGVGVMGRSMVRNLLGAGYEVAGLFAHQGKAYGFPCRK